MAAVAAHIDGFNLYYGMKRRYDRRYLWLDVVSLVRRLRPDDDAAYGLSDLTLLISADSDFARPLWRR